MASFAQFGNDLYTGRRQIDFIGRRKLWYLLSAVFLAIALVGLLGRGMNFSLEFTGGSELRVQGVHQLDDFEQRAKDAVQRATGVKENLIVTKIGDDTVRVQSEKLGGGDSGTTDKVSSELAREFGVTTDRVNSSYIGPSWGKSVTDKAIKALIVFLILVSLVLAVYFRTWAMAAAALVALLHDLVVTTGIYALTGIEVSPASMIGFLTILGYSIYDTVVVFDKVRENTDDAFRTGRRTFAQAANYAVNQTLVRSINTSVVALLPIAAILLIGFLVLGPGTLLDIALALFVGVAVGTYSSIFIATPLLVTLRSRQAPVRELDRRAGAFQATQAKVIGESDAEHTPGESASGVVEPEVEQAAVRARANRQVHPLAVRDRDR